MTKKRVLVGYGIDVDAVANWINTEDGTPQNPTNVSRGIYGATVGVDRLLDLLTRYNIKATWFTPAHTIESFPKQMAKVRDAGHEIGLHGYTHEYPGHMTSNQQLTVLSKSIQILTSFTGHKPLGYTAPAWLTSKDLIPQLQQFGIIYDHSFMHHDVKMYYAPDTSCSEWVETKFKLGEEEEDAGVWMRPMTKLVASGVVEIPANWHLDDWPPLQPKPGSPSHGYVDTSVVEKLWMDQFDYAYRMYDTFVFPMTIHPQVSGKLHGVLMHERIIEHINKHEGVEWMTFGEMAVEFKEGRVEGVEVEGGVER